MAFHARQIKIRKASPATSVSPHLCRPGRSGKFAGPVYEEQGSAVDFDVAVVCEGGEQMLDVGEIVLQRVVLPEKRRSLCLLTEPK